MNDSHPSGSTGRRLASNTLWNLFGQVLPAIVGILAIPRIVHGFGVERFGVLTLAWMVVGYFSLFDLGLGRAITKVVAELLASNRHESLPGSVWTAWYLMLALGVIGALIATLVVPVIITHGVRVSPGLREETRLSFYLLAASIPVVVLTTGVRGVLEAAHRFDLVNAVRAPTGVLTFVVPLASLHFTSNLAVSITGLIVVRLLGVVAFGWMCMRILPSIRGRATWQATAVRPLLTFGAWMTVSNIISPMMVTFDRFFISGMISVVAVTYYATPFEAVSKLLFIPAAIAGVLFPAFAASVTVGTGRTAHILRSAITVIVLVMLPVAFIVFTFAPEILRLWLGVAFAQRSTPVMRWLMAGILMNSIAQMPFAMIQGLGRSDLTAKVHLIEAPLYLVLLVWITRRFGIDGVAFAWFARAASDMAILLWLSARSFKLRLADVLPHAALLAVGFPAALLGLVATTMVQKTAYTALFAACFFLIATRWGVSPAQRSALRNLTRRAVRQADSVTESNWVPTDLP